MKYITALTLVAFPLVVSAQDGRLEGLISIVEGLGVLVDRLIPIAFAAALLFFFWGLAKFILGAGDDEKRQAGRSMMFAGVVALFIMASILGIIDFIGNALGIEQGGSAIAPGVEFE